ncbi:MAG: hypothetical protein WBO93_04320 [Gammaproteobacteria bacterium]
MSSVVSDVAVHVDEALSDRELFNLEQTIRSEYGVISVGHSAADRHMMFVLYDPEAISGKDVLSRVTDQGFHGELIGF